MGRLPTPRNLSTWITHPKSQLSYYYTKTQTLITLNKRWKAQTDLPLTAHSNIANFELPTLTLVITNPMWASHLHYAQLDLLNRLRQWPELKTIKHLRWYIQKSRTR